MVIKNISGEARYFGFGRGTRGRSMANNGTSTVPDNDPFVAGLVQNYVNQRVLQVMEGPAEIALVASINTPASAFIAVNGAVADNDKVTVGGVVFEFENDPGAGVLGSYVSTLTNVAWKWAGDGAAAATAVGTLRTAVNVHTATTGIIMDAAVQYDTGLYVLPLRASNGSPTAGTSLIAATGANLAIEHGSLLAGVTGAAVKQVVRRRAVIADDVNNAVIVIATGLGSIISTQVSVVAATGIAKYWNGATLTSGGNVILNNVGLVDWAATDIITVTVTGL